MCSLHYTFIRLTNLRAALRMQMPDPSSRRGNERNVVVTLVDIKSDTYMLIILGGQLRDQ